MTEYTSCSQRNTRSQNTDNKVKLHEIVLIFKFVYFVMKTKTVGFNKYVWA